MVIVDLDQASRDMYTCSLDLTLMISDKSQFTPALFVSKLPLKCHSRDLVRDWLAEKQVVQRFEQRQG